jgi:hypothetical protein
MDFNMLAVLPGRERTGNIATCSAAQASGLSA